MTTKELDRHLPGIPSKALVLRVRRALSRYGVKPQERLWRITWEWASACSSRQSLWTKTRRWPSGHEIASQYVFVLMAEMRAQRNLRLPFHAGDCMTDTIREIVSGVETNLLSLPAADRATLKLENLSLPGEATLALPMPQSGPVLEPGQVVRNVAAGRNRITSPSEAGSLPALASSDLVS